MNENKKRCYNKIRRQDVNAESEKIGINDKYENSTIIKKPYNYIDDYLIKFVIILKNSINHNN
tara:strand:- start:96 stop:284 length:189 start_codon:yes stop_codon:yes gene_type:complete